MRIRIRRAVTVLAAMGLTGLSVALVGVSTAQAKPATATITSVTFGGTQAAPTITVSGSGFGTESDIGTPNAASDTQGCSPATGYDYGTNMYIYDETDPTYFVAGLGPPNLAAVGVNITTYTDSEIVFTPGSCYGQNGWTFAPGDNFTMYVLSGQYSGNVSYPTETTETDWSAPLNVDGSNLLTSVSCASSSFSAAVDLAGNVLTYDGSSWSAPNAITEGGILSVSCASTTFCVDVGEGGGENTWNGSSWNGPGPVGSDEFNLNSVSCPTSQFCVAVDDNGGADTWDGSTWTGPTTVDSEEDLTSVSCVSSSFCAAVDDGGNALVYDGVSWTSAGDVDGENGFESVSCSSAAFCVAVDNEGNALTYNGASWSSDDIDGSTQLASVDCVTTSFCVAGDTNGNALTYNGSSWSSVNIDDNVISSVSCPTTSFCAATDDAGNVLTYGWVSAGYTCSAPDFSPTTFPVLLSESPSPPPSITAPGTYQTTLSAQITVPASAINEAVEAGVTSITIGSQSVTVDALTGGSPSSSVDPNALTASATNLPISFTPEMNTPYTFSTTYNPETWKTVSDPGTVDFTPGDINGEFTYVISGTPSQVAVSCTPPSGVSPLDSTVVDASSSTPTFQVPSSVPPLQSQVTAPLDDGWAIAVTNTSTVAVDGLSALVTVHGGGGPLTFDFTGMANTGTTCISAGTDEATCNVGTLGPGGSLTINALVETTGLAQGTAIKGTVDITSSNTPEQSSDLGTVNVVVVTNGVVAVAVPTVGLKSALGPLTDSNPAKVRLTLPAKVPAMGAFGQPYGAGKVKGPPVSVTLVPLAGSQDPELCPQSTGGCEGDIMEINGNFAGYTSSADPIAVVVKIFYGSSVPAGKIYFQTSAGATPVRLATCVLTGGVYNTPCRFGAEKTIGTAGSLYTSDTVYFTGNDPLVGRR